MVEVVFHPHAVNIPLTGSSLILPLLVLFLISGAVLEGVGIAIEKASQMGGSIIRKKGVHLESLAIIESMHDGVIKFKDNC